MLILAPSPLVAVRVLSLERVEVRERSWSMPPWLWPCSTGVRPLDVAVRMERASWCSASRRPVVARQLPPKRLLEVKVELSQLPKWSSRLSMRLVCSP